MTRWSPVTRPIGPEPPAGSFGSIVVAVVAFVVQFAAAYGIALISVVLVMAIPATALLVLVWVLAQVLG